MCATRPPRAARTLPQAQGTGLRVPALGGVREVPEDGLHWTDVLWQRRAAIAEFNQGVESAVVRLYNVLGMPT